MARSTKFLGSLAALGLIGSLGAGCGGDTNTQTPPGDAGTPTDRGTTQTDVPSGPGQTYDYVINRLLLNMGAEPPASQGFYGFNLDNRFSPSTTAMQQAVDCSHGDYFSVVDPDQNMGTCANGSPGGGASCRGGVDNQLPNVAQTIQQFQPSLDVQGTINEQIEEGSFLIVVRVTDVNGTLGPTLNDPSVNVLVYPYAFANFTNCANIQMPGQSYTIDNRSLTTPGDLSTARLRFSGSIVNGRLVVAPPAASGANTPNFSIPLTVQDMTLNLDLFQTQLRFTLGATEGTNGNLGGYLKQTTLINALTTIPALMQFRDAAAPLIQGFVDIATGTPVSCDNPEGGIGVGLGFTTRSAMITPMGASAGTAGNCGVSSSSGSDAGTRRD